MIARLLFTGMDATDRHQGLMLAGVLVCICLVDYLAGLA